MAEEMQGIMALQEGQDQGEMGQFDLSQFSPEIEGYAKTNPRQFSRDILGGIAEADPALAEQFVSQLSAMQLPPEVIDALQLMVDNILNDPSTYVQDRQKLIAEGVPEEILPEQFDPAYFAAFNLALDQIDTTPENNIPAFAEGGIVNVRTIAKDIAAMGRGGDTMLAHITPEEARMLRQRGGSGTINPKTGLREYFIGGVFKAIGSVFKGVGKAIKGVVKGIGSIVKSIAKSAIGKMALTFAAAYFMGPAGLNFAGSLGIQGAAMTNAVNTFAGSALVNVASGQKIGEAIKGGLVSGALAGAGTAAFGGGVPGAKPVPTTAGAFEQSMGLSKYSNLASSSLDDVAGASAIQPVTSAGPSSVSAVSPTPGQAAFEQSMGLSKYSNISAPYGGAQTFALPAQEAIKGTPISDAAQVPTGGISNIPTNPVFKAPSTAADISQKYLGTNAFPTPAGAPVTAPVAPGGITNVPTPSIMDSLKQGNFSEAASNAYKYISPSEIQKAGIPAAQEAGSNAIKELVTRIPSATPAMQQAAYDLAYKSALPGTLSTYGPLAAVGLGAATLGGAFKVPEQPMPDNIDQFKTTGKDLLNKEPEKYGLNFGGVNTTYASNPYDRMYESYKTPKLYAGGGEAYPRKVGHISGPGTGTSDSVPAMLSDGEFVFTAKAVRAMGQGSRRKGAKRMYALMKQLEKKG
jgi:hypothetical protein